MGYSPNTLQTLFKDIATPFDTTKSYAVNDYVLYNGFVFRCTTAHTGAWVDTDFTKVIVSDEIENTKTLAKTYRDAAIKSIAPDWVASTKYELGNIVSHYDSAADTYKVYKCINSTVDTSWVSSHWKEVSAADCLASNKIIAPEYSSSSCYAENASKVMYKGQLYICISNITTPEEFNYTHWTAISIGDYYSSVWNIADNQYVYNTTCNAGDYFTLDGELMVANYPITTYSASKLYNVGDWVVYSGKTYVCNTAVTTAEPFDASKWTVKTIGEVVSECFTLTSVMSEMSSALSLKADASNVYTKTETDTKLNLKANSADVYTKSQVYTKTETDTELAKKIDNPASTVTTGYVLAKTASGTEWREETVTSVQGETGAVTLTPIKIGAANASHQHNLSDIVDAGTAAALDADSTISATATGVATSAAVVSYAIAKPTEGTNGQVLATDGAGHVSWIDQSGGGGTAGVSSINGKTGIVTITGEDVKTSTAASSNTIATDIAALQTDVAAKYEKASTGIPKSDLDSDVQTSLGKADTAYQKPSGGITSGDMSSAVQIDLLLAETALQPDDLADWAKAATKPTYTYTEVGAAAATHTHALSDISDAGSAASKNAADLITTHDSNTVYTTSAVYDNFIQKTAANNGNNITANSSGLGLSVTSGSNITNVNGGNVNVTDGTDTASYYEDKIEYTNGGVAGSVELDKIIQDVKIGNTTFTNSGNTATLSAGTSGQVLRTSSTGGAEWHTLTNTDVGAAAASHEHAASDITSGTFDAARISTVNLDALTATTTTPTIPLSLLPAYVNSVQEYDTFADFPATGSSNIIYLAKDTNMSYRWGGSSYIELAKSVAIGETADSAYRGDRGKIAYEHALTEGALTALTTQGLVKVALSSTGHVVSYTSATKQDIIDIVGSLGSIDTISINGTALPISSSKDVALPITSDTALGLAEVDNKTIAATSGVINVVSATDANITARSTDAVAITTANFDAAVKQALTNNSASSVTYSDTDKTAAQKLLDVVDKDIIAGVYDSSETYDFMETKWTDSNKTAIGVVQRDGTLINKDTLSDIIKLASHFVYYNEATAGTTGFPVSFVPTLSTDKVGIANYNSSVTITPATSTLDAANYTVGGSDIICTKSDSSGWRWYYSTT